MPTLQSRRDSVIRDLDAIIGRFHSLRPDQWQAATPLAGWDVLHIGTHLVNITAGLTTDFRRLLGFQIDDYPQPIPQIPHDSAPVDLIASLTANRNILTSTIERLTDDDLDIKIENGAGEYGSNGNQVLDRAVFEAGLHRYDIDASVDRGNPGLDLITLHTIDTIYGANLDRFAERSEVRPSGPITFQFKGTIINRSIAWNGTEWSDRVGHDTPTVIFQGDESALALLLVGRIPPTDHRIGIIGDRSKASQFKTFVPGP